MQEFEGIKILFVAGLDPSSAIDGHTISFARGIAGWSDDHAIDAAALTALLRKSIG